MTTTKRRVGMDGDGKSVISNLRVPFERGSVVWVLSSSTTVTVSSVEPVKEEHLSDVEVSEATTLLEKLRGMDLLMEGGAYRFVPKVQP